MAATEKGKLIVIDGLDGSGKGTHTKGLYEYLLSNGFAVKAITFPDYSQPSSALIKMYLSGEFGQNADMVNPYAASSFYAVDRVASFLKFWKSDYDNSKIIIADRYTTSNIIHQTVKLPQKDWISFIEWTQDYEYCKLKLPRPDLILYLDMPVHVSKGLIMARYEGDETKKDIHERDFDYLLRCREAALFAAERLGWTVVSLSDGQAPYSKEENQMRIREIVNNALK